MRVNLQTKPSTASGTAATRRYSSDNVQGIYSLRDSTTLTTGNESVTLPLGAPPFAGSLVAIAVEVSQARTAGTVTVDAKIAGVTKLTATIDGTNTTKHKVIAVPGTHAIAALDSLTVDVAASSFTPTSTDVRVVLYCTHVQVFGPRQVHFLRVQLSTATGSVNNGNALVFDQIDQQVGDSCTIDTGTGIFTLAGGGSYLVWLTPGSQSNIDWQLYDVTGTADVTGAICKTFAMDNGGGAYNGSGNGHVVALLEPASDNEYELRNVSGSTASLGNAMGSASTLNILRLR